MQLSVSLDTGQVTTDALGVSGLAVIHAARLIQAQAFKTELRKSGADLGGHPGEGMGD